MIRFRLLLFPVMAVLICQQGTAAGQFLVRPAPVVEQAAQPAGVEESTTSSITIPAGTTVLMSLRSPLNTVSAQAGSGLYLETMADVIQQNRIAIPAKTLVQGVVERQERPGRVKGRGQLQFHLTTLILPSNYTASIAGSLQSLPGSGLYENNREGAIQPVDQIDKDAASIVKSVAAGAAIGSISRGAFGAGMGSLIGVGFGVGKVLFKRGDDIGLPVGTPVEMVLDRPLTIPIRELTAYTYKLDVPANRQPSLVVRPDRETSFRRSGSPSVAVAPEGSQEVRFYW